MNVSIVISFVILAIAVTLQAISFFRTQRNRLLYKNVFPKHPEDVLTFVPNLENGARIEKNVTKKASPIFKEIINSINNYLGKNRDAVDFSIIKDISDRNSDAVFAQVEATSPNPIYIGLCGTLLGIVVGVANLAWGGGLDNLFNVNLEAVKASSGITELWRGVGVALLTTFSGIVFSIIGTLTFKSAQAENEKNKNAFFSWIQAELLPKMDNGIAGTLDILQRNLNKFNSEFSQNSQGLVSIAREIKEAAISQVELYRRIKELDIEKMATANTQMWRELQGASEQLAELHKFLFNSQTYLRRVQQLNDKLDSQEDRTRLIEEMGQFFKEEIKEIEQRKVAMNKAVSSVDEAMKLGLDELERSTLNNFAKFVSTTENEQEKLSAAVEEQQKALTLKLSEIGKLIDELHNLNDVKSAINTLSDLAKTQNDSLEAQRKLIADMLQLQRTKKDQPVVVNPILPPVEKGAVTGTGPIIKYAIPGWVTASGVIVGLIVVATCVILVLGKFNIIP